jgi:hypothetical protein
MQTPGRREAEFIGKVTASATHEIRNVLAIVKESAGLISDLVHASGTGGGAPHADRLLKAAGRIDAQVARGADIVTHLNRFAHSMDEDVRRVDLDEEVHQVAFLSQRLARAKSQTIRAARRPEPVWLTGNSLHVQMALYATVAFCLEHLPVGCVLELRAEHENGAPEAHVRGAVDEASSASAASPEWGRLEAQLADLGVCVRPDGEGVGVRLLYEGGG